MFQTSSAGDYTIGMIIQGLRVDLLWLLPALCPCRESINQPLLTMLTILRYQLTFGILNAQHYGAPQKRRRFFIIAAKSGLTLPSLPQPTHYAPKADHGLTMRFENMVDHNSALPIQNSYGIALFQSPTIGETISDLPE
jgi:DNA (cytosine-5)-methyltransferase 1